MSKFYVHFGVAWPRGPQCRAPGSETGSEPGSETVCGTGSEPGSQTVCETGSQTVCETGSETVCDTGSETVCDTGYRLGTSGTRSRPWPARSWGLSVIGKRPPIAASPASAATAARSG